MSTDKDMLIYNAIDAAGTLDIRNKFFHEVDDGGYRGTYDFTVRLFEPLMYMQTKGIRVDFARLNEVKKKTKKQIEETEAEIHSRVGWSLNPNSANDCKKYFYIEKGIPAYTKKGSNGKSIVTCDDKALTRIARGTAQRRGLYEASLIQKWRGLSKMMSSYYDINFDEDGRLRCSFNPRGTRFGRLSSSKTIFDTGMNMQNLPTAFKEFLMPDPGHIFIEMDKRQAEWVVVAFVAGDANMIKVIKSGGDPHVHTASEMFGVPPEIVVEESKVIGHETNPDEVERLRKTIPFFRDFRGWVPRTMSMRQCGKKSNHGLNYDETFKMFSLINEITEKEAKVIVDFYHRIYPGIRKWHDFIKGKLAKDRVLENCFGRKYQFLGLWGQDLWKAAYAMQPQSTVADIVNWGIIHTYEDYSSFMKPVQLLGQVHDSILFQYPISQIEGLARAVTTIKKYLTPTLNYGGREFVVETDMKIGLDDQTSWAKLKDCKLVDDSKEQEAILRGILCGEKGTQ